MPNLTVKIGDISLKNPLICGSGEHFIELSGIDKALKAGAGAVVIKSTNENLMPQKNSLSKPIMPFLIMILMNLNGILIRPETPAYSIDQVCILYHLMNG